MSDNEMERRTIAAGSIIKLNGIPVEVCEPFEAATHPNNWKYALAPQPERDTGEMQSASRGPA